ncbi:hypothetical protein HYFRA_00000440 [Hymenoscyphus fraxineus]|uniref:RanBD1 domain-containing protein n=1 Tax=Hymenoscyphus fraxineus TaxID=746836 RepID=A0A9N9L5H5_9HELO|nr:hypothetical protein HYFRA_00000440 [Hymenoscyphus fraxineus]
MSDTLNTPPDPPVRATAAQMAQRSIRSSKKPQRHGSRPPFQMPMSDEAKFAPMPADPYGPAFDGANPFEQPPQGPLFGAIEASGSFDFTAAGAPQWQAPAQPENSPFDRSTFGGFGQGAFASTPAQAAAAPTSNVFGSQPSNNIFTFGSQATTSAPTSGFGGSTNNIQAPAIPAPAQTTAAPTSNVFGSQPSNNIFTFGSQANTSAPTPGFGGSTNNIFGQAASTPAPAQAAPSTTSSFFPPSNAQDGATSTPATFSFGQPAQTGASSTSTPAPTQAAPSNAQDGVASTPATFSFGQPAQTGASSTSTPAPAQAAPSTTSSFFPPSNAPDGVASTPATFSFGQPAQTAAPSTTSSFFPPSNVQDGVASTPATFSFGQPAQTGASSTSTPAPAQAAPSTTFSFGQPAQTGASSTPFTFGGQGGNQTSATPGANQVASPSGNDSSAMSTSTPAPAQAAPSTSSFFPPANGQDGVASTPATFSFGQPAQTGASSTPFTFGGQGGNQTSATPSANQVASPSGNDCSAMSIVTSPPANTAPITGITFGLSSATPQTANTFGSISSNMFGNQASANPSIAGVGASTSQSSASNGPNLFANNNQAPVTASGSLSNGNTKPDEPSTAAPVSNSLFGRITKPDETAAPASNSLFGRITKPDEPSAAPASNSLFDRITKPAEPSPAAPALNSISEQVTKPAEPLAPANAFPNLFANANKPSTTSAENQNGQTAESSAPATSWVNPFANKSSTSSAVQNALASGSDGEASRTVPPTTNLFGNSSLKAPPSSNLFANSFKPPSSVSFSGSPLKATSSNNSFANTSPSKNAPLSTINQPSTQETLASSLNGTASPANLFALANNRPSGDLTNGQSVSSTAQSAIKSNPNVVSLLGKVDRELENSQTREKDTDAPEERVIRNSSLKLIAPNTYFDDNGDPNNYPRMFPGFYYAHKYPIEKMEKWVPSDFTSEMELEFYSGYRMRMLREAFDRYQKAVSLDLACNMYPAMMYFNSLRGIILSRTQADIVEAATRIKRKARKGPNQENQNVGKRIKTVQPSAPLNLFGKGSLDRSPTKPANAWATENRSQPAVNGSSSQAPSFVPPQPAARPVSPAKNKRKGEELTKDDYESSQGSRPLKQARMKDSYGEENAGSSSSQAPSFIPPQPAARPVSPAKNKRKGEELTKDDYENSQGSRPLKQARMKGSKGDADAGSNTLQLFQQALDSPAKTSPRKVLPEKGTPSSQVSDDKPRPNPFGGLPVPGSPSVQSPSVFKPAGSMTGLANPFPAPSEGSVLKPDALKAPNFGTPKTDAVKAPNFGTPKTDVVKAPNFGTPMFGAPNFGAPKTDAVKPPMFGAPKTDAIKPPMFGAPKTDAIKPPMFGAPKTDAVKPPIFGAPVNFLDAFKNKAEKDQANSEQELMEKFKEREYDSEEEAETEWEAKYWKRRELEKKKLAEDGKKATVPKFGIAKKPESQNLFGPAVSTKSPTTSVLSSANASRSSTPARSIFDGASSKPVGKNIFAHLSDSGGSPKVNKDDEESDDDQTEGESDSENKDPSYKYKPDEGNKSGPGTPVTPVENTGAGIASTKKLAASGGLFGTPSQAPQTPGSGTSTPVRSLFDRIAKDKDGNPIRVLPTSSSDEKENTQPPKNKNLFASLNKPTGSSGDQLWKSDTPIKFGAATPTSDGSGLPAVVVQASTPTTNTVNAFGNLFGNAKDGKPASFGGFGTSPANSSGAKPAGVGFGFGVGATSATSSLFPSVAGSTNTSRATTPGVTTEGDEADPDGVHHEQIDLTAGGPGEEDEDVIHEVRAKVQKWNGASWDKQGLGPLRVLRHKLTKATRILVRADPSGTIVMNKALLSGEYKSAGKTMKITTVGDDSKPLETWLIQVKTSEFAKTLAEILQANKPEAK